MSVILPVELKIVDPRLHTVGLPAYATEMSAGVDLRACIDEPLDLWPGECRLVSTGIAVHIGDPGYMMALVPRSGLGHRHSIVLGNGLGLIDADFQGVTMLSLWNRSAPGTAPYRIEPLERVAQAVFLPIARAQFSVVDAFSAESERGEGGFGHSGRMGVPGESVKAKDGA